MKFMTNCAVNRLSALLAIIPTLTLFGCSYIPNLDEVLPDRRTEYRKAEPLPDLEVPPDLTTDAISDKMPIPKTTDGTATYSNYQERAEQGSPAAAQSGAPNIKVLDNEHVLVVTGGVRQVFPELRRFWKDLGYTLSIDDEDLGVMETEWRVDQQLLTRDQFKVFAEPGATTGTSVLYISHNAEEMKPHDEKLVWVASNRDAELERRVVDRLADRFGTVTSAPNTAVATTPQQSPQASSPDGSLGAEIVSAGGGKIYLNVDGAFGQVWTETGEALRIADLEVDESDRDKGLYTVRIETADGEEKDSKGFFSRLKFWGDDDEAVDPSLYKLSLTDTGDRTEIVVLNSLGEWSDRDEAKELLRVVYDHLKDTQSYVSAPG